MTKHAELKKLQKEEEKITQKINELLDNPIMSLEKELIWENIGNLIENNLLQEELCNE